LLSRTGPEKIPVRERSLAEAAESAPAASPGCRLLLWPADAW